MCAFLRSQLVLLFTVLASASVAFTLAFIQYHDTGEIVTLVIAFLVLLLAVVAMIGLIYSRDRIVRLQSKRTKRAKRADGQNNFDARVAGDHEDDEKSASTTTTTSSNPRRTSVDVSISNGNRLSSHESSMNNNDNEGNRDAAGSRSAEESV
jgi:Na+-transporting methylmalonyl-CoA/oxaloacetate decarboxylase gamma subunit